MRTLLALTTALLLAGAGTAQARYLHMAEARQAALSWMQPDVDAGATVQVMRCTRANSTRVACFTRSDYTAVGGDEDGFQVGDWGLRIRRLDDGRIWACVMWLNPCYEKQPNGRERFFNRWPSGVYAPGWG